MPQPLQPLEPLEPLKPQKTKEIHHTQQMPGEKKTTQSVNGNVQIGYDLMFAMLRQ